MFSSVEELTHIVLESQGAFLIIFTRDGAIHYVFGDIDTLLGYTIEDFLNINMLDIIYDGDLSVFHRMFSNSFSAGADRNHMQSLPPAICRIQRGDSNDTQEKPIYEPVKFIGYICATGGSHRQYKLLHGIQKKINFNVNRIAVLAVGILQIPLLYANSCVHITAEPKFQSRHTPAWKFLTLDETAVPIIRYSSSEVADKSAYDYCHMDDLDLISTCHATAALTGQPANCCYRFLTKGQQWIWLYAEFQPVSDQSDVKVKYILCSNHLLSCTELIQYVKTGYTNRHT